MKEKEYIDIEGKEFYGIDLFSKVKLKVALIDYAIGITIVFAEDYNGAENGTIALCLVPKGEHYPELFRDFVETVRNEGGFPIPNCNSYDIDGMNQKCGFNNPQ